MSLKKVKKDFCGVCSLSCLSNGMYFKLVRPDGSLTNKVYVFDSYDRSTKKYIFYDFNDINNYHSAIGSRLVSTDFIF